MRLRVIRKDGRERILDIKKNRIQTGTIIFVYIFSLIDILTCLPRVTNIQSFNLSH